MSNVVAAEVGKFGNEQVLFSFIELRGKEYAYRHIYSEGNKGKWIPREKV